MEVRVDTDIVKPAKRRARKSNSVSGDVVKGNPEHILLGKPEEKPARVHAPLPKRQRKPSEKSILADIKLRRQELESAAKEYMKLEAASKALENI
jgi:hypothetical protein